MFRPKLLMMQRNEGDLLRKWAYYHTNLIPKSNISIYDNGSDDPETVTLLERLRIDGYKIHEAPGREAFEGKGQIFGDVIRAGDNRDWYIPMDCDEFLCNFDGMQIAEKENMFDELEAVDEEITACRLNNSMWNIPGTSLGYFQYMQKVALRGGVDFDIDTGFHFYDWGKNQSMLQPETTRQIGLGFLHFHNKPFESLLKSARQKLEARTSLEPHVLAKYNGSGAHLVRYFFMTESQYLAGFEVHKRRNIALNFERFKLEVPFSR